MDRTASTVSPAFRPREIAATTQHTQIAQVERRATNRQRHDVIDLQLIHAASGWIDERPVLTATHAHLVPLQHPSALTLPFLRAVDVAMYVRDWSLPVLACPTLRAPTIRLGELKALLADSVFRQSRKPAHWRARRQLPHRREGGRVI